MTNTLATVPQSPGFLVQIRQIAQLIDTWRFNDPAWEVMASKIALNKSLRVQLVSEGATCLSME